jgi:hypothetical protein
MRPFAKSPMQMRREAKQRRNSAPTLEPVESAAAANPCVTAKLSEVST